ncbi:hypothetical protein ACFQ8O_09115 [Streptomyces coelicoflavus]|uniref:hypothetical protein n=1 Tax=Streptomyces coelicoflavus TaxID=285562 RepID=UPI0036BB3347
MPAETAAAGFQEHVVRGVRHLVEAFPAYVAIGYNTGGEVRRVLAGECSHEGTAAWEYAYWPLEGFARVGHVPEDRAGSADYIRHTAWRSLDKFVLAGAKPTTRTAPVQQVVEVREGSPDTRGDGGEWLQRRAQGAGVLHDRDLGSAAL